MPSKKGGVAARQRRLRESKLGRRRFARAEREKKKRLQAHAELPVEEWTPQRRIATGNATDADKEWMKNELGSLQKLLDAPGPLQAIKVSRKKAISAKRGLLTKANKSLDATETMLEKLKKKKDADPEDINRAEEEVAKAISCVEDKESELKAAESELEAAQKEVDAAKAIITNGDFRRRMTWAIRWANALFGEGQKLTLPPVDVRPDWMNPDG